MAVVLAVGEHATGHAFMRIPVNLFHLPATLSLARLLQVKKACQKSEDLRGFERLSSPGDPSFSVERVSSHFSGWLMGHVLLQPRGIRPVYKIGRKVGNHGQLLSLVPYQILKIGRRWCRCAL